MKIRLLLAMSVLGLASSLVLAEPYVFDASHTRIGYSVDHMGLSEMHGAFRKFEGSLQFDAKDLAASSVDVSIDVASIDTGIAKLDEHLRAADFFDVAQFAKMHFKSSKVEPTGASTFKLHGDLTLHGVTKPVVLDVSMRTLDSHPMLKVPAAGFLATTKINRSDFGITTYPGAIGEQVTIRIDTETRQAPVKAASE